MVKMQNSWKTSLKSREKAIQKKKKNPKYLSTKNVVRIKMDQKSFHSHPWING